MNSAVLATSFVESSRSEQFLDDIDLDDEDDQTPALACLSNGDLLLLNIGGQGFKLTYSTVGRLPESSLLHQLAFGISDSEIHYHFPNLQGRYFCLLPDTQEFYFDRSPRLFECILTYCYTGHIHCPDPAMMKTLDQEFHFWGLPGVIAERCCRPDEADVLHCELNAVVESKRPHGVSRKRTLRRIVSIKRQRPNGDGTRCRLTLPCCAKVFTSFSVFFLALSILNLVLSTEPLLQSSTCWFMKTEEPSMMSPALIQKLRKLIVNSSFEDGVWFSNSTDVWFESFRTLRRKAFLGSNKTIGKPVQEVVAGRLVHGQLSSQLGNESSESNGVNDTCHDRQRKNLQTSCINSAFIFDLIETICMAWFTLEYLVRFVAAHCRLSFLKDFLNIIDMFATIPFYVEIALDSLVFVCYQYDKVDSFLAALKVLRVFRIFKLARYFRALRVFGLTLVGSKRELATITMFTSVTIVIFSSVIYYVEKDDPDTLYVSIPASMWWAIVTITTVGYGDMSPKTVGGKIVGAVACVSGILILAFPVSILTEHFMTTYKREVPASTSNAKPISDDGSDPQPEPMGSKLPIASYVNNRPLSLNKEEPNLPTSSCYLEISNEEASRRSVYDDTVPCDPAEPKASSAYDNVSRDLEKL